MTKAAAAGAVLLAGPFVSYAREDQPFVRRLHEALGRRQRDTWVDWEGIYPTEEWMARIRAAIDAAPAFVFIISPDSVASTVCGDEIEHAVSQNKRIIPILCREVHAALVHPSVAKLNWLQFRATDDFDAQVDALVAAMDLDIDWLRAHTRLLVRAEEWHRRDRDDSLLLRGRDLQDAERWLLSADTAAKRIATPLQTQFIVSSRQADTRRRNIQRTIAAVAVIVLAALSVYSWTQKTLAERQRNLAISRQLAARATSLGPEDTLTRLLVSALATRYSHSAEADASLARSLLPTVPLGTVLWSPFRDASMDCIAFHRGGAYVAGSNSRGVTVWHAASGRVEAFLATADGVDCVSFGPRDDIVAIADEGRVILWEWRQDRRRTLGAEPNEATTRVAFSPDGRSVFAASRGQITRWDVEQASSTIVIDQPAADDRFTFSSDGTRVAGVNDDRAITIWDLESGRTVATLEGPSGGGMALAFSADGRTLAAGRDSVRVWELAADGARLLNELDKSTVTALAFSADGETIAAAGTDGGIALWDFRRRRQRTPLQGPRYGTASLAFSPNGSVLASGAGTGAIWLWKPAAQNQHILQRSSDVELAAEESTQHGQMLGLKRGHGFLLWDLSGTRRPVTLADFPSERRAIRLSGRGDVLTVLTGDGRIGVWNTDTGQPIRQIVPSGSPVERIDVSATGALVAAVGIDGDIMVADVRTGTAWSKAAGDTGHARSIVFSPDGRRVASGGLEGAIDIWTDTGEHVLTLQNGDANVLALAFSPDATRLAASSRSAIVLWDLEGGTIRRTLRGHTGPVTSLAFSSDGAQLASGSLDQTARLWNPLSGEELFRIDDAINPSDVIGVAFAADGKTLATRSRSGTVNLWDMDGTHWTELACAIVNRNLTPQEWDTFLPSEPYRAACPTLPGPSDAIRAGDGAAQRR